MSRVIILCIDDEREVLDSLARDLRPFADAFLIERCESADEARQVVQEAIDKRVQIGLVLADHVMPGTSGVQFLVELNKNPLTTPTRKVLVTAHAGHADTIRAVNEADLDYYISKPWQADELVSVVRRQLCDYVIANVEDLLPFMQVLDSPRLLEAYKRRGKPAD